MIPSRRIRKNDYAASELRLNTTPYSFSAKSFDSHKTDLDLEGLAEFFSTGPELRGASVNKKHGLVLYGSASSRPTLAGHPVELAALLRTTISV